MQALLARGADANLADGNGDTPLHAGLRGEEEEDETQLAVLQMLLKGGASADAGNGQFPSPAHFCAERGRVGALKVLLDAKADPSVRDKRTGFTPLHLAARAGAVSAVEALLGAGADPNAASASGSTPLHLAALNKRAGAVEAILRLAAGRVDAGAKNAMGARCAARPLLATYHLAPLQTSVVAWRWKRRVPSNECRGSSGWPCSAIWFLQTNALPSSCHDARSMRPTTATPLLVAVRPAGFCNPYRYLPTIDYPHSTHHHSRSLHHIHIIHSPVAPPPPRLPQQVRLRGRWRRATKSKSS